MTNYPNWLDPKFDDDTLNEHVKVLNYTYGFTIDYATGGFE